MLDELDQVVGDTITMHSKLVLLVGTHESGKSGLLSALAKRKDATVLKIGTDLGRQLVALPRTRRHLMASELLGGLADGFGAGGILFIDNIELLFDRSLRLDPLSLLKRHAHSRRIVAVWPGEFQGGRLIYATTGHPEFQDYGIDGLVPFVVY